MYICIYYVCMYIHIHIYIYIYIGIYYMYINHIVSELQTYFLSFFCHLYSLGIIPKPAPSKHQNSQKKILK